MSLVNISDVVRDNLIKDKKLYISLVTSIFYEFFENISDEISIKNVNKDNILEIEVKNSSLLQELSMKKEIILKKLNKKIINCVDKDIKNIVFRLK